ncbi:hypothetical protein [Nostoc sp.]
MIAFGNGDGTIKLWKPDGKNLRYAISGRKISSFNVYLCLS